MSDPSKTMSFIRNITDSPGGPRQILDNKTTELLIFLTMVVITPAISVSGIVGNCFSIVVLRKQGLRNCSNILLFGLAISDILYLVGYNSISKIIYTIHGGNSYSYSPGVSMFLFILYQFFIIMDYSSGYSSMTIPMLITIERLITVFFPLKVSRIITPTRTWAALAFIFSFWYTNFIYISFWLQLGSFFDIAQNRSIFIIERSLLFHHDKNIVFTLEEIWAYISMRIPPAFTMVGCFIIGVKIKQVSVKRQRLTASTSGRQASMNRTTKTLVTVCVFYTIACAATSLPVLIPEYATYILTDENPTNIAHIVYQFLNIVLCINGSCNFIIYIVLNKNFRDTYKSLFVNCPRTSR